jgi:hypothetical protein
MSTTQTMSREDQKRAVRRTTLWLALLAFGFYAGFIVMSVLKAR